MRILLPELRQLCSRVREVDVTNKIFKLIGKRGRTTVPFEIRMKMRLGYNSLVSYELKDEDTLILRKEKICDGCKEPTIKEATILDVVNSLSDTEQKALYRYLSIRLSKAEREA